MISREECLENAQTVHGWRKVAEQEAKGADNLAYWRKSVRQWKDVEFYWIELANKVMPS